MIILTWVSVAEPSPPGSRGAIVPIVPGGAAPGRHEQCGKTPYFCFTRQNTRNKDHVEQEKTSRIYISTPSFLQNHSEKMIHVAIRFTGYWVNKMKVLNCEDTWT